MFINNFLKWLAKRHCWLDCNQKKRKLENNFKQDSQANINFWVSRNFTVHGMRHWRPKYPFRKLQ